MPKVVFSLSKEYTNDAFEINGENILGGDHRWTINGVIVRHDHSLFGLRWSTYKMEVNCMEDLGVMSPKVRNIINQQIAYDLGQFQYRLRLISRSPEDKEYINAIAKLFEQPKHYRP